MGRGYVQAGQCDGLEVYTEAEAAAGVSACVYKHLSGWESYRRFYLIFHKESDTRLFTLISIGWID